MTGPVLITPRVRGPNTFIGGGWHNFLPKTFGEVLCGVVRVKLGALTLLYLWIWTIYHVLSLKYKVCSYSRLLDSVIQY